MRKINGILTATAVGVFVAGTALAQPTTKSQDQTQPATKSDTPGAPAVKPPTTDTTKPDAMKSDSMKSDRMKSDSMKSKGDGMMTSDREDVRSLQQALKDKGHDPGDVDGRMGPKTREALREFQKKEGLDATGRIDSGTREKLGMTARTSRAEKTPSASPATGGGTASGPMSAPPLSDKDAAKGSTSPGGQTKQPQTR